MAELKIFSKIFIEINAKFEIFSRKVLNIKISLNFWLIEGGNGIFNIHCNLLDHTIYKFSKKGAFRFSQVVTILYPPSLTVNLTAPKSGLSWFVFHQADRKICTLYNLHGVVNFPFWFRVLIGKHIRIAQPDISCVRTLGLQTWQVSFDYVHISLMLIVLRCSIIFLWKNSVWNKW